MIAFKSANFFSLKNLNVELPRRKQQTPYKKMDGGA